MKRVGEENANGFIFKKKKAVEKVNFRRSSFGHRGKRLLEIHPSLPVSDYYKHISPLDSDPIRMKQLLLLIGHKTACKTSSQLGQVQLKLLEKLKSQSLSWYHRKNSIEKEIVVKQENPVNASNRKQLQEFSVLISNLSKEMTEWKSLLQEYSQKHEENLKCLAIPKEEISLSEPPEIPQLLNLVGEIHQLRNVFYKLEISTEKISKTTEILFSQILKSFTQKSMGDIDTIQMLKLLTK